MRDETGEVVRQLDGVRSPASGRSTWGRIDGFGAGHCATAHMEARGPEISAETSKHGPWQDRASAVRFGALELYEGDVLAAAGVEFNDERHWQPP